MRVGGVDVLAGTAAAGTAACGCACVGAACGIGAVAVAGARFEASEATSARDGVT